MLIVKIEMIMSCLHILTGIGLFACSKYCRYQNTHTEWHLTQSESNDLKAGRPPKDGESSGGRDSWR